MHRPKTKGYMKQNGLELQIKNKGKKLFLTRNGRFFQAFNEAAHLIGYLCHYKVYRIKSRLYHEGTVKVGFPIDSLDRVKELITSTFEDKFSLVNSDVDMVEYDVVDDSFVFPNVDIADNIGSTELPRSVLGRVLALNLAETTPMQALNILTQIQIDCRKAMNDE